MTAVFLSVVKALHFKSDNQDCALSNSFSRFKCSGCSRSWPSNNVMVAFHMRLIDKKGTAKVKHFHQSCTICSNAPMETPSFSSENINILMEKLVEHITVKCYGKAGNFGSGQPAKLLVRNKHEPEHCEACKAGVCKSGGI